MTFTADQSTRLGLPFILPAQAQKHVTHNEALSRLDALVQLSVEALDAQTPPDVPLDGGVWALGSAPTGAWADHPNSLAQWSAGAWHFQPLQEGWCAVVRPEGVLYLRGATEWRALRPDVENVPGVGINTTSDSTNRLSVAAPASLFSHDGSDHRMALNKASPTDTASVVFQSNWSARAEMGLAGQDDFSFKVSPDGASWQTALSITADTGSIDTPVALSVGGALRMQPFSGGALGDLMRGTAMGGVIEGRANGHLVLAIRENNAADSVSIVSGGGDYDTDNTHDTLVAIFQADGMVGLGHGTPKRTLHIGDAMRLEPGPEPLGAAAGDLYFDDTSNVLRCFDGTVWHDLF